MNKYSRLGRPLDSYSFLWKFEVKESEKICQQYLSKRIIQRLVIKFATEQSEDHKIHQNVLTLLLFNYCQQSIGMVLTRLFGLLKHYSQSTVRHIRWLAQTMFLSYCEYYAVNETSQITWCIWRFFWSTVIINISLLGSLARSFKISPSNFKERKRITNQFIHSCYMHFVRRISTYYIIVLVTLQFSYV